MTPTDRKYAKTHEWVKLEGTLAVVGITDHAQEALGDITFVDLPAVGKAVTQGRECAVIESVKAAADLFAPVSGTVAEVNTPLADTPEIVNRSPYDQGWVFKVKDVDPAQLAGLMDAAGYDQMVESEK